jgi:phage shock protein A
MFDQFKENMEERNQQTQNELNSTKEALDDLGKKHKNAIEENKQLEAKFTEMKDKHSKLWEDIGKVSYK